MRIFASSGTTGNPSVVRHSNLEWHGIVFDTAVALAALGVTSGSLVLIGHPSFPWSIGQAFADATVLCGAAAICFGLSAEDPSLASAATELRPSHFVAPAGMLMDMNPSTALRSPVLVVVGESISASDEAALREKWSDCSVRRIYGSSECGTVAYQASEKSEWLRLVPRFRADVEVETPRRETLPEGVGELWLWDAAIGRRIRMGDYASVRIPSTLGDSWQEVKIHSRVLRTVTLRDGSRIEGHLLQELQSTLNARHVQLVHIDSTHWSLSCCPGPRHLAEDDVLHGLRMLSPDFFGIASYEDLLAQVGLQILICSDAEIVRTHRGKVRPIVDDLQADPKET